jgi:hypothetical protein
MELNDQRRILVYLIFLVACLCFMYYTQVYYQFCNYSIDNKKLSYFGKTDKPAFEALCQMVKREYKDHKLLNLTITGFYSFFEVSNTTLLEQEIQLQMDKTDYQTLRNYLYLLVTVHLIIHTMILYVLVMKFPIFFIHISKLIISKLLYFFFVLFFVDGSLKIILNYELMSVWIPFSYLWQFVKK